MLNNPPNVELSPESWTVHLLGDIYFKSLNIIMKGKNMSNLIRYIIQEDPEKQIKKNDLDYAKYSTSWAPIQKQSQEDKYKGYKFSSKNLLENSFNYLTSNKSSQSKDEGSFMSGISNIFNNIKSDTKSSSNASLPQSVAKKLPLKKVQKSARLYLRNLSEMMPLHTKLLKITKEIQILICHIK